MTNEEVRKACAEIAEDCMLSENFRNQGLEGVIKIAKRIRALEIPQEDQRVSDARRKLADIVLAECDSRSRFPLVVRKAAREYYDSLKAVEAVEGTANV